MSAFRIEVFPERTTSRGRVRPAEYLFRLNYPPFLSGQRVTITSSANPETSMTFSEPDSLEAVLALLRSLDYEPKAVPA